MVIYEVNLFIKNSIFLDYKHWLDEHILEMLTLEGFLEAKILSDSDSSLNITNQEEQVLIVQYLVKSLKDLKTYFDKSATLMRQKSTDKFGDKFRAQRRILEVNNSYLSEKH